MKKTMVTALVSVALLVLALLYGNRVQIGSAPPMAAVVGQDDPIANPDDLDAIVPDGKELTFKEFEQKAANVAQLLSPLNPTHIKRDGTKFTLTCTPATITRQGATLYVSSTVTCEATKNGNVISLKKIDGVQVDVGLGKMKLREASINPSGTNSAKVDGKLEVSRWLPYVPFSVTVDTNKP